MPPEGDVTRQVASAEFLALQEVAAESQSQPS